MNHSQSVPGTQVVFLPNHVAPRLPLDGNIDLTYRCNNICRHCWVWLAQEAPERSQELSFEEIRRIVDEARSLGCRRWAISGGEPMLRPDFADIFAYITRRSAPYSLNTNGTLITPEIARLLTRKGAKMIALCGATPEVHDRVTRNPGSFEATMQGFAYLREAGAGFTVQLIPMRGNFHEWDQMVSMAQSLSPSYRVGAPWLYLTSCGSVARNREIARQRLDPRTVVDFDPPHFTEKGEAVSCEGTSASGRCGPDDDRLLAGCIINGQQFRVDPYGQMTFCYFIHDPTLCYDLRRGTFREGWEEFIPSLSGKVLGGQEYAENCGSCAYRTECRWCPALGYLEQRRYSAPVPNLCEVARESHRAGEEWRAQHCRYYRIGGITIRVSADLPITDRTFAPTLRAFEVASAGEDTITIHHHFEVPNLDGRSLGQQVHRKPPWAIYRRDGAWTYLGISSVPGEPRLHRVATFNQAHTRGVICNEAIHGEAFKGGGVGALTLFPTDQVLLARVLADRQGCILHAAGMDVGGHGFLFAGHSEAGKSSIVTLLREEGTILCDDRIIVRRWPEGFRIHGTWSHGDVPDVSPGSAPLHALLFLEQADENRLIPITDRAEVARRLPFLVIKPLVTADWWHKTFDVLEHLVREVPAYRLRFDLSGGVRETLQHL